VPETLFTPLILFGVGLIGGTINAIAGGGSLLMLPVLIFLGLPPTVANGTNRVAILIQNMGATGSFHRRGLIPVGWLKFAFLPALVGAGLGTFAAIRIGDLAFQRILVGVMVMAAAATFWRPNVPGAEEDAPLPTGATAWMFRAIFFGVGAYGGFIQAGLGFVALAVTSAVGLDLIRGNAFKVALVLGFTPLALAGFAMSGQVDWVMGFTLAAGTFLGGLFGVHLQVLKGQKWVRGVVTVMIVLFAARLLFTG
jgi:uncharacterized protein